MKPDSDIERDVETELKWRPDVDDRDIAVKVSEGVVTLTGFVHDYDQKHRAETVAKRIAGVVGLANDIEVRLPASDRVPDPEITREAVGALRSTLPFSAEKIKVLVVSGRVTLEGAVEWQFQRQQAESAVRRIKGVTHVTNHIQITPKISASDVKRKIEDAFRRSAEIDANRITVEPQGSEVTLRGKVRSWAERQEAERVAWFAPGVTRVKNEINIGV